MQQKECVILLHGLVRRAASMSKLEKRLIAEGYTTVNVSYPSRRHPVDVLAKLAVEQGLRGCKQHRAAKIHFVTHSLGGILLRVYLQEHRLAGLGRAVMLGPPNQGSEVVDHLKDLLCFKLLNGPAGMQLGTALSDIPKSLGPVDFDLGIIAGTKSVNVLLSLLLPRPNDGKVSVESAKVEGMRDFLMLPTAHPFMMKNATVIAQTVHFLKYGAFRHDAT